MLPGMPKVLSLVSFSIDARHRGEFLARAAKELKAYWEGRGSERYEVYERALAGFPGAAPQLS